MFTWRVPGGRVDGSFGVTSRIFLSEMTPSGRPLGTVEIPPNELVTSFSSKSELALNLSPDGRTVSFMGYAAKPGEADVSNSTTPGQRRPGRGPEQAGGDHRPADRDRPGGRGEFPDGARGQVR